MKEIHFTIYFLSLPESGRFKMVTQKISLFLLIVISVCALPHNYNEENVCGYQVSIF